MQGLPLDHTVIGIVQKVTRQRMPDVLHMHADLVRASGFQPDGSERKAVFDGKARVMCHGPVTVFRINNAFDGAAVRACNRRVNHAAFRQRAGANGTVFAVDFTAAHLLREDAGGQLVPCKQHQAGGVAVEPPNRPRDKWLILLCEIICERIGSRVVIVPL